MKSICESCSERRRTNALARARAKASAALRALIAVVATFGSGGCATLGAKPWDRDLLAEQAMQLDSYAIERSVDDHIYFSKEASSGGRSFAGGGCGCN